MSRNTPKVHWRHFSYIEIRAGDKDNLDNTWLRNGSLEDSDALPVPELLVARSLKSLNCPLAVLGHPRGAGRGVRTWGLPMLKKKRPLCAPPLSKQLKTGRIGRGVRKNKTAAKKWGFGS